MRGRRRARARGGAEGRPTNGRGRPEHKATGELERGCGGRWWGQRRGRGCGAGGLGRGGKPRRGRRSVAQKTESQQGARRQSGSVALGVRSSAGAEEAVAVRVASTGDLGDEERDGGTLTEGLSVLTGGAFAGGVAEGFEEKVLGGGVLWYV
eukprot:CAMPEP_0113243018 /NCGR_PEP_ID=MMETSP0008_2-20120614/7640_1 /TAXON_ID=97485 /ORGANISM="Prymnesium parvum" /LENGTH=151 /DNA_ID=CAMNT_0000090533 /DNA_START=377 /DNA_END=831 /DNA_ORIENTATION=- /assembly_acc=CAM_ASM_000153